MNLIIVISILIRIIAIVWSIFLLHKLRDWRMGFLTIMLALMALRQIFTAYHGFDGWYLTIADHVDELPGLVVSLLSLIIVIALERIIEDQKATDKSLELYKDYFDAATSGLFVFDDAFKLIDVNSEACRMHGYSYKELMGMKPTAFIHPDSHSVFDSYVTVTRQGKVFHGFGQGVRKDGGVIDVEVEGLRVSIDNKNYYVASLIDVTEKIKAQNALKESEEKYRSIVETTDEWIWEIDIEGRHTYSNNAIEKILGYKPEEVIGKDAFTLMLSEDHDSVKEMYETSVSQKKGWKGFVIAWKHKDGSKRYMESTAVPILDGTNQLLGFRGADRDVTERKEIDKKLRLSEERYRALYNDNPSMFFTVDKEGIITSVNRFGADQLGYTVAQLIGQPVEELFYQDDKEKVIECLESCFLEPDDIHRWELRKVRKNGTTIWVRETARIVYDDDNNSSIFIVCEDFSDTYLLSEQLTYQASHDALTGLINRREFEIRLNRTLETARMYQSEHALCYLDLDQFKVINDACGHMAGDELLRQVSHVLQKRSRKRDTLARLGGDEFGILMEYCNIEQASKVANEILHEIEQYRFEWGDQTYSVGVSIGLVPVNEQIADKTEILREADAACYAAKDAGRNRIHIYSADDLDLARRHGEVQWISRINNALENNYFILYGQPIVAINNKKNKAQHYEILIRLKEGSGGEVIPPGLFLPAAERYNLATRIDKWVISATFDFLNSHPEFLFNVDLCSINLSGKSLADDGFLKFAMEKINESEGISNKICFEITETAVISNMLRASLFIRKLKELGCRFSLDDFGSGLSSFGYLKTLPVDYLKIDGLFVKDIVDDETDYAMVKSINDIGQVMGIETIAEFVENDKIKEKLVGIGVNFVQGYGIGRPEPLENIARMYGKKSQAQ